jgi:hypothetical protein
MAGEAYLPGCLVVGAALRAPVPALPSGR